MDSHGKGSDVINLFEFASDHKKKILGSTAVMALIGLAFSFFSTPVSSYSFTLNYPYYILPSTENLAGRNTVPLVSVEKLSSIFLQENWRRGSARIRSIERVGTTSELLKFVVEAPNKELAFQLASEAIAYLQNAGKTWLSERQAPLVARQKLIISYVEKINHSIAELAKFIKAKQVTAGALAMQAAGNLESELRRYQLENGVLETALTGSNANFSLIDGSFKSNGPSVVYKKILAVVLFSLFGLVIGFFFGIIEDQLRTRKPQSQ